MTDGPNPGGRQKAFLVTGAVVVAFGVFVVAGQAIFVAAHRHPPAPAAGSGPAGSSVSAGGFTLTSVNVDFPDDQPYPQGAGGDVMNANCTACHSASMVLTQPALSKAQWTAEVDKMRKVYKAPVADKDVPAVIDYLTALQPAKAAGGKSTSAASDSSG